MEGSDQEETSGLQDAFFAACASADLQTLKRLTLAGVDVNIRDGSHQSALEIAIASCIDSMPIVEALLGAKANPNARFSSDETPLERSCSLGNASLCHLLIEHGASVLTGHPLHCVAAGSGDVATASALLEANHELLDQYNDDGVTPLYLACLSGKHALAHFLLERGAKPQRRMLSSGNTALHAAAYVSPQNGARPISDLISYGALVNATSSNGYTALHAAAFVGSVDCCSSLLRFKADPTIRSQRGYLPQDLAVSTELKGLLFPFPSMSVAPVPDQAMTPRSKARRHSVAQSNPVSPLGSTMTSSGSSPVGRVRVSRNRSISSPFLQKHRRRKDSRGSEVEEEGK